MKIIRKRTIKHFTPHDSIFSYNKLGAVLSGVGTSDFESVELDVKDLLTLKKVVDTFFRTEYGKQYVREEVMRAAGCEDN